MEGEGSSKNEKDIRPSVGYTRKILIKTTGQITIKKYHSNYGKSKRPIPFHTASAPLDLFTAVSKNTRAQTSEKPAATEII